MQRRKRKLVRRRIKIHQEGFIAALLAKYSMEKANTLADVTLETSAGEEPPSDEELKVLQPLRAVHSAGIDPQCSTSGTAEPAG